MAGKGQWLARAGVASAVTVTGLASATPAGAQANGQDDPLYGDLNADGVDDRATLGGSAAGCTVAVELGDGAGGYLPASTYTYPNTSDVGYCPDMGVIVDLGGDGVSELVLAWFWGRYDATDPHDLLVLRDYTPVDGFSAIWQPSQIGTADFNGDGLVDVYEWTDQGDGFQTYLNTPSSELVSGPLYHHGTPDDYELVDVDENGADDLVMVYSSTSAEPYSGVVVVLDDGTTTYLQAEDPNAPTWQWWSMDVGDFNGDGHVDVTTTEVNSGDVVTFYGDGTGVFTAK
jgi:hypothetical protein